MEHLLNAAKREERNEEFKFFLSGDLAQLSVQHIFLNSHGIETRQNNVYPCLKESDVKRALTLIWKRKTMGWWHYKDKYIEYKICTEAEFKSA